MLHLSGAPAKPVSVLLPFLSDWRGLLGREDNPVPVARRSRQPTVRDWREVIGRVHQELQRIAIFEKALAIKAQLYQGAQK